MESGVTALFGSRAFGWIGWFMAASPLAQMGAS
jgi:hypothetical protein